MSELTQRWRALLPRSAGEQAVARRLAQGGAFYRSGRVAGLRVAPGRLSASVQGARATPYHVEVLVGVLEDTQWRVVVDVLAAELRLAAALLAGRWPDGLFDALGARGIDFAGAGLDARCPCGEADRPCAHLVALWDAAAARFDEDPFAFPQLRGRGRQRLLADLSAARRARGGARPARLALGDLRVQDWTRAPEPLADLDVAPEQLPEGSAPPLRLLGDPPGWAGATSAYETFAPLVEGAARYAARLAGGGDGGPEPG